MSSVLGIDSSTQSCKVVVRDIDSGTVVSEGHEPHPEGTEVWPEVWWEALHAALNGVDQSSVEAVSVGAQQHGMILLDDSGKVLRPALLWNDTRSAPQAQEIIDEFGLVDIARRTGSVPVASFTSTKLAWVRRHEPEIADRAAAVCLPHDWLTWRLRGFGPRGESPLGPELDQLTTERSDASGTGYFLPSANFYDEDVLRFTLGHMPLLPRVLEASEPAGTTADGWLVAAGGGDNAIAALGLGTQVGDAVMSLGTSGTVSALTSSPTFDPTGTVAGFADAAGSYLPLVATLNAARAIDAVRKLLGLSWAQYSEAVLSSPPGSEGLSVLPFFDGERTPNLPDSTGLFGGATRSNLTAANLARAVTEGVVANLAEGLQAITEKTEKAERLVLIGGGARNSGIVQVVREVLSLPTFVPDDGEYVALGAGCQAAWALTGTRPDWEPYGMEYESLSVGDEAGEQFRQLLSRYS